MKVVGTGTGGVSSKPKKKKVAPKKPKSAPKVVKTAAKPVTSAKPASVKGKAAVGAKKSGIAGKTKAGAKGASADLAKNAMDAAFAVAAKNPKPLDEMQQGSDWMKNTWEKNNKKLKKK
jgi:hypothetical protein